MAGDRGRQTKFGTKEINRSCLAIVLAEDCRALLIFGPQVIIDMSHRSSHFLPAKLVRDICGRGAVCDVSVRGNCIPMARMYATSLAGGKMGITNGASTAPLARITTRNPGLTHLSRLAKILSTATPPAAKSIGYAGAK